MENIYSYDVIIKYLHMINLCYKGLIKHLQQKCPVYQHEIINLLSNEILGDFELFINKFNFKENTFTLENNFFVNKLIFKVIFSNLYNISINNNSDIFGVFEKAELQSIEFFEKFFNTSPYINSRKLINEVLQEKYRNVKKIREMNSA